jgi:uncharacterized membrane protein
VDCIGVLEQPVIKAEAAIINAARVGVVFISISWKVCLQHSQLAFRGLCDDARSLLRQGLFQNGHKLRGVYASVQKARRAWAILQTAQLSTFSKPRRTP